MKEQTVAYLEKAREHLDQADTIYSVGLYEPAGRSAYLAGFHAAQALIFETNGRIYKRHGTVQGEFGRLVKDDARVDGQIRAFLGRTYDLKAIADYLTGPASHISAEMAREAVDNAKRFVECVASLIPPLQADPTLAERFRRPPAPEADPEQEPDHEPEDDLEP